MSNVSVINEFILNQVRLGNMDEDMALKILKEIKRSQKAEKEDIAIIGVACRFPKANNIDEYWANLLDGVVCIGKVPENRIRDIGYLEDNYKSDAFLTAAYLDEIDKFDAGFFGISPNEALSIQPHQRIFMQVAYEAIEDAGYGGNRLDNTKTGVFVGMDHATVSYEYLKLINNSDILAKVGSWPGMLSSRIAYALNLIGPNMVIDTACSSGLVSVHTACNSLNNKECDMAIAGGVNLILHPKTASVMQEVESIDGHVRPFDKNAKGTVWGEGVGAILLKPLSKAISDKDNIYAIIKGSAVNSNGTSNGITAPSAVAQEKTIVQAWQNAKVPAESITYFETHGTGTLIGDPIEINGITSAFKKYTSRKQFCAIGSLKPNIGHCVGASGIASMLKVISAMNASKIPPASYFNEPNPFIKFHKSPIYVNDKACDWYTDGVPKRAGISSFGFTGTNCHIVLEEAPQYKAEVSKSSQYNIFTLSAKNKEVLDELITRYIYYFDKNQYFCIDDICYTANIGRGHYNYRLAFIVKDFEDLQKKLQGLADKKYDDKEQDDIFYGEYKLVTGNKVDREKFELTQGEKLKMNRMADIIIKEQNINDGEYSYALLKQICSLYVKGTDIRWEESFYPQKRQIIKLPVYAFKRDRYWPEFNSLMKPPFKNKEIDNTLSSQNYHDIFYGLRWIDAPACKSDYTKEGSILIFKDKIGIADEIIKILKNKNKKIIEVEFGEKYDKLTDYKYIVNNSEEAYKRLFQDIRSENLTKIIHFASIIKDVDLCDEKQLEISINMGLYSLFFINKAIMEHLYNKDIDIILVSDYVYSVTGKEREIKPSNAALFGIGKVLMRENDSLRYRCVDIETENINFDAIISEIHSVDKWYQVAYRNGKRFVEEFKEIDVNSIKNNEIKIEENDVYVITGGIGGLGLEISKYLASNANVNLIFINRTKLPERSDWDEFIDKRIDEKINSAIKAIKEIEKSGSSVTYYNADVSSCHDMQNVINNIKKRFSKVNGIIHCAGVFDEGYLAFKDEKKLRDIINPKIFGTWILDKLTREFNLKFFILFSSIATLTGMEGQGAYTAANSYLDSYEAYRNNLGMRTLTINWGIWQDVGGAIQFGANKNGIFKTISSDVGIRAFDKILKSDINRVLITDIDFSHIGVRGYNSFQFAISPNIINIIEKNIINANGNDDINQAMNHRKIELIGRKDGRYKEIEINYSKVWGEVFGFKELNIYDNFYELGGDSRIATKIANMYNKTTDKHITPSDVLKYPTIEEFGRAFDKDNKQDFNYSNIKKADTKEYYPLALSQKRLFIINSIDTTGLSYNIPLAMKLIGEINKKKLEETINKIVERHEVLRTSIQMVNAVPVQKIHKDIKIAVKYLNNTETDFQKILDSFFRPFELNNAPLIRVGLLKITEKEHILLLDMHHIISDGTSVNIFIKEFISLYNGFELNELAMQYKDFAEWQSSLIESDKIRNQEIFWLNIFKNNIPNLNMPTDFQRPAVQNYRGETIIFELDKELTSALRNITLKTSTTFYMLLMSIYYVLLSKYSEQEDITIGMPISGRTHTEFESLIGMFVNVLVIRNYPKADKIFYEFLLEVKESLLNAYENQDFPFSLLVEKLGIVGNSSRNPLFDVSFVLRSDEMDDIEINDSLSIKPFQYNTKTSRNDMLLEVVEHKDIIRCYLEYSTSIFKRETIERLIDYFKNIAKEVSINPYKMLKDIQILPEEERLKILADFNEVLY